MPKIPLAVVNGPIGRRHSERATTGSAHPHINLGEIRGYAIPICPLADQHRIIAEIERRLPLVDDLDAALAAGLKRADRPR